MLPPPIEGAMLANGESRNAGREQQNDAHRERQNSGADRFPLHFTFLLTPQNGASPRGFASLYFDLTRIIAVELYTTDSFDHDRSL